MTPVIATITKDALRNHVGSMEPTETRLATTINATTITPRRCQPVRNGRQERACNQLAAPHIPKNGKTKRSRIGIDESLTLIVNANGNQDQAIAIIIPAIGTKASLRLEIGREYSHSGKADFPLVKSRFRPAVNTLIAENALANIELASKIPVIDSSDDGNTLPVSQNNDCATMTNEIITMIENRFLHQYQFISWNVPPIVTSKS